MARCKSCESFRNLRDKKSGSESIKKTRIKLSEQPSIIRFSTSEDPFHSFSSQYYCTECNSIYELEVFVDMHSDGGKNTIYDFTCLSEEKDFGENHYVKKRLQMYLDFEVWKKKTEAELLKSEKIKVYQFRTAAFNFMTSDFQQTKENELVRTKRLGHLAEDKYKTYLSLDDFHKRWSYGPQFAFKAELLEFEVNPKNIRIQNGEIADNVGPLTKLFVVEDVKPENIYVINPLLETRTKLSEFEFSKEDKKEEYKWYEEKHKQLT